MSMYSQQCRPSDWTQLDWAALARLRNEAFEGGCCNSKDYSLDGKQSLGWKEHREIVNRPSYLLD